MAYARPCQARQPRPHTFIQHESITCAVSRMAAAMQMEMQMKLPVSIGVLRAARGGGLDKKINQMICISSRPPSLPPSRLLFSRLPA